MESRYSRPEAESDQSPVLIRIELGQGRGVLLRGGRTSCIESSDIPMTPFFVSRTLVFLSGSNLVSVVRSPEIAWPLRGKFLYIYVTDLEVYLSPCFQATTICSTKTPIKAQASVLKSIGLEPSPSLYLSDLLTNQQNGPRHPLS